MRNLEKKVDCLLEKSRGQQVLKVREWVYPSKHWETMPEERARWGSCHSTNNAQASLKCWNIAGNPKGKKPRVAIEVGTRT